MIDLYTWPTPYGWKLAIALEELELPYEAHMLNVSKRNSIRNGSN